MMWKLLRLHVFEGDASSGLDVFTYGPDVWHGTIKPAFDNDR